MLSDRKIEANRQKAQHSTRQWNLPQYDASEFVYLPLFNPFGLGFAGLLGLRKQRGSG